MNGYLENLDLSIDLGILEDYKLERLRVIAQILYRINKGINQDNWVLKGGTGLLMCYGLDRFSEDIDLDGIRKVSLEKEIKEACNDLDKYSFISVAKDTETVLRYKVDYQSKRGQQYQLEKVISSGDSMKLFKP